MSIRKHKQCLDSVNLFLAFQSLFYLNCRIFFKASVMGLLRCGWTPADGFSNSESTFPKILNMSRKYGTVPEYCRIGNLYF